MAHHNHFPFVIKSMITALFFILHCIGFSGTVAGSQKGQWQLLLNSTGVVAMHMALTHHNTVIMFDQTEAGPSGYRLRRRQNGNRCTDNRDDVADSSCYAHSVEYDISSNRFRPLRLYTDTWCSSGSFLSNGTLLQTGGYGSGTRRIRYYRPCDFNVTFLLERKPSDVVEFTAYAPPFTTHSISMNQRLLKLRCKSLVKAQGGLVHAVVEAPPSANVAPSGYYMLTVVNGGTPSMSEWVRFMHH
ncbi:hypothetical protein C1H46_031737 [Malus baccata]|uniref:Glyoxal oxidase N-terminal domain-containing protein n=1 Tax=Malus baccata TaxID=106549 RepID=A0A540L8X0_MALBA|nr:hypothetical protein C1H46_031737 [Malus baccata]